MRGEVGACQGLFWLGMYHEWTSPPVGLFCGVLSTRPVARCSRYTLTDSAIYSCPGSCPPLLCLLCSGSDEEEEEWSDDEDTSWKVRRAAAKGVAAVISHYPDLLAEVGACAGSPGQGVHSV